MPGEALVLRLRVCALSLFRRACCCDGQGAPDQEERLESLSPRGPRNVAQLQEGAPQYKRNRPVTHRCVQTTALALGNGGQDAAAIHTAASAGSRGQKTPICCGGAVACSTHLGISPDPSKCSGLNASRTPCGLTLRGWRASVRAGPGTWPSCRRARRSTSGTGRSPTGVCKQQPWLSGTVGKTQQRFTRLPLQGAVGKRRPSVAAVRWLALLISASVQTHPNARD